MEQKNKSGIIIGILIGVIIVLTALVILFATDTISFNNNTDNTNKNNNSKEESNDETDNNETNNNLESEEQKFIREKKVTLVAEPNCTGNSSSLIATIESNGNISISQNKSAVEIVVGNAKYLYSVAYVACDNIKLYFITEDKELYVINQPNATTINQKAEKATESKVIEFIGTESGENGSYLKVLLENGEIESVKYFPIEN